MKSTTAQATTFLRELHSLMATRGIGDTPVWEGDAAVFPPPAKNASPPPDAGISPFQNQEDWPSPLTPLVRIPLANIPEMSRVAGQEARTAPADSRTFAGEQELLRHVLAGTIEGMWPKDLQGTERFRFLRFLENVCEARDRAAALPGTLSDAMQEREQVGAFFRWMKCSVEDLEALGRYGAMAMLAEAIGHVSIGIYRQSKKMVEAEWERTGWRNISAALIEERAFSGANSIVEPPWKHWSRAAKGWQMSLAEYVDGHTERFRIDRGLIHSWMANEHSLFVEMLETSRAWCRKRGQEIRLVGENLRLCLALARNDDAIDWPRIATLLQEVKEIWTRRNKQTLSLHRLIGMAEEEPAKRSPQQHP